MHKIKIEYYDKNIIILNKPIGIEIYSLIKNKIKNNLPNKGILNRLDKYTTGLIMIARNLMFYYFYKKITIKNIIKKNYIALVKNIFYKGFINLSIIKKKNSKIKKFFKKSLTFYKKFNIFSKNKIFFIYIKTGKTHQIRIHLNYSGIILKNEYYYKKKFKFINTLHFKKISFFYPLKMKKFFLSCNLPIEMKKNILINLLK